MIAKRIKEFLRSRREAREQEALRSLKARYHMFRAILNGNERSLELLSGFDAALIKRKGLGMTLEELLSVTFEIVDGLNRLSGNRYANLYAVHDRIAAEARSIVAGLDTGVSNVALTVPLDQAGVELANYLGGKAAFLGEMMRAGFSVPVGFAATTQACRRFVESTGLNETLRGAVRRLEGGGDIALASRDIQGAILNAPLPDDVAGALLDEWSKMGRPPVSVRSSALVEDKPGHSFAGQFKTILGVRGEEELLGAYRKVIAGNFGLRPLTYRLHAGLPVADFDMAVIVQKMVDPRAAGVLFTMHPTEPGSGRMLITAVPGLGSGAVGGSAPADMYRPLRDDASDLEAELAEERSSEDGDAQPLLGAGEIAELVRWGRLAESVFGAPQDMEWAVTGKGELFFLQSRTIRFSGEAVRAAAKLRGSTLISQGTCASSGRVVGKARVVRSKDDLEKPLPDGPVVLVLGQSLVDAARLLPDLEGVIVELGNPADHLSCVAREHGAPMLTGAARATEVIGDGEMIILDADEHLVLRAPETYGQAPKVARKRRRPESGLSPEAVRLRDMVLPLNLTDSYGPTFSITECRSLHDIVRFAHEKAIMGMFEAGDEVLEEADSLVKWLEEVPMHFLVIDLGGGLAPGLGRKIRMEDVRSAPLAALCEGMMTPDLRWRQPPPGLSIPGLMSKSMVDGQGDRPVGSQNFALISRDYLNLNARVDFHFAMIDSVCGPIAQENYVRFRFKGGGTTAVQRERRAGFIHEILRAEGFFSDIQGDLVTASKSELPKEELKEQLRMLGRLLGFSRLMDGAMNSDEAPKVVAEAFMNGNWSLEGVEL